MPIVRSFGCLLFAAVVAVAGSQSAQSGERAPLTKVLLNVEEMARDLARLDYERGEAETSRAKARAEFDVMDRKNPRTKRQAEELEKRIRHAEARIRLANAGLGKTASFDFEVTSDEQAKQVQLLPQKLTDTFKKINGVKIAGRLRIEPIFNPSDKRGVINIRWKGSP